MKIQMAKKDLEAALKVVNPALGSGGGSDEVMTHYVFRVLEDEDGNWGTEVLTYGGRLCAKAPIISKVERADDDPTMFTVEGFRLKGFLGPADDLFTLELKDKSTVVYHGSFDEAPEFQSLNPDKYPLWDKGLAAAKKIGSVSAAVLRKSFQWARLFTLDDEVRRPDLCVFESRKGQIYSTNTKTVVLVTVPGLEESKMRVHGADAVKILSFLDVAGEGEVDVLESDAALYLKRSDGAVFGESRFSSKFPKSLTLGKVASDPLWWEVEVKALQEIMTQLLAVASTTDNRLRFQDAPDGSDAVRISMVLDSGKGSAAKILPKLKLGGDDKAKPLRKNGFALDHNELKQLLSAHTGDTIRFGIHQREDKPAGFVRFSYEEGAACQIILAWLKE